MCKKSAFHRRFSHAQDFLARQRRQKSFAPRIVPALATHGRSASAARHLHTKLSEVTVIFFLL